MSLDLDRDLLSLLPHWYREILDYQEICQTEEAQLDALAAEITGVADNFFFQTMDAAAVSQWEQIFGIVPNLSTEDLSFRRARLLNRISTRPPYTLGFLYQKLDELIGPGAWQVTMDYPNYTLYVESSAQDQQYATEVAYTIGHIKPAHIVYINRPFLQDALFLSETVSYSSQTFNYKLGLWQLGLRPFVTDQSGEVVKMPSVKSIQNALLTGTANFVSSDVAKARVNGSIVISNLTKSVSGSTFTVTYPVLATQTTEVTQVELLDSSNAVLTSSQVYVPVTDSVVMRHSIPVSEGVSQNG